MAIDKILRVNENHVVVYYTDGDVFHIKTVDGTALAELLGILRDFRVKAA